MKLKLSQRLIVAFGILLFATNVFALEKKFIDNNTSELELKLTTSYGIKVVQVSMTSNEEDSGSFQVTNSDGTIVSQIESVELIKSPNYFTINVSDYKEGDYTFQVTGKTKKYTSTIHIK